MLKVSRSLRLEDVAGERLLHPLQISFCVFGSFKINQNHHPHQNRLYQAVVRIDQHVVSLEAIEVKNELNHFKFGSPEQGVTKIEPESGDFWRGGGNRTTLPV